MKSKSQVKEDRKKYQRDYQSRKRAAFKLKGQCHASKQCTKPLVTAKFCSEHRMHNLVHQETYRKKLAAKTQRSPDGSPPQPSGSGSPA